MANFALEGEGEGDIKELMREAVAPRAPKRQEGNGLVDSLLQDTKKKMVSMLRDATVRKKQTLSDGLRNVCTGTQLARFES